jgi:hypothetical protein
MRLLFSVCVAIGFLVGSRSGQAGSAALTSHLRALPERLGPHRLSLRALLRTVHSRTLA